MESLLEGMTLHVIPSDKFMTDTLCVLIRRPLNRDEATLNALLPPVLSRGSAPYPNLTEVTRAAERMCGSIFESHIIKKGEQQIMQFYFECVDDPVLRDDGLLFLRDMILQPLTEGNGFKTTYTRSEADNLRNRIEGRVNNKSEYAKLKCVEYLCEDEPFGVYGDGYAEDLPGIDPSGLLKHYKKNVETSPIDFIAIGRWDEDRLRERIAELFSVYRDGIIDIPKAEVRACRREPNHPRIERLETGATQGNMCVGLRGEMETSGEGYIHFQLANEVLGGGATAKLFTHVREKESLCYRIQSFVYRFKGMLCIQCGVDAAQFDHVLALIGEQIEATRRGEITDEELDNAKRALVKRWRSLKDYPSGCVDFYASQYLLGDTETIEDMAARVASANREGVAEAASRLNMDTVVMLA